MIELVPDITIIFHAIVFLLVVLVMSKFVFIPLVKLFRRREFETKVKSREASILNRKSDICDNRRKTIIEFGKKSADDYRKIVINNARELYRSKIDETRKKAQEVANSAEVEIEKDVKLFLAKSKIEEDSLAEIITNNVILGDK